MISSPEMPDDRQWKTIGDLLAEPRRWAKNGPIPVSNRRCFEALLWLLWTGSPRSALPRGFPTPSTCARRLDKWIKDGSWERAFAAFVHSLDESGRVKWRNAFIDASFELAQKSVQGPHQSVAAKDQRWRWSSVQVFQAEAAPARKPAIRASTSPKHSIAA